MSEKKVKWVKRANAWALIKVSTDPKTGKQKQTITWHDQKPEI